MKQYFVALIFLAALVACNGTSNSGNSPVSTDSKDTAVSKPISFFPVTDYLKGQLKKIDTLPLNPVHYTTVAGKRDSSWVQKKDLAALLAPFIQNTIAETNLVGLFKETSFNDETLHAITLTYDPKQTLPDSVLLKKWTVYIVPETGEISKVYLVQQIKGTTQQQQLTWNADHYASIVTIETAGKTGATVVKEEKILWDLNQL